MLIEGGSVRACERLLAAAVSPDNLPLSKEEREIIAHYADALDQLNSKETLEMTTRRSRNNAGL